jgi:hypothetical protein
LDEERERLTTIAPLFDELEAEMNGRGASTL